MFGVHGMSVGVLLNPVSLCTFFHTYTVERPRYCLLLVVRSCGSRLRLSSVPGRRLRKYTWKLTQGKLEANHKSPSQYIRSLHDEYYLNMNITYYFRNMQPGQLATI